MLPPHQLRYVFPAVINCFFDANLSLQACEEDPGVLDKAQDLEQISSRSDSWSTRTPPEDPTFPGVAGTRKADIMDSQLYGRMYTESPASIFFPGRVNGDTPIETEAAYAYMALESAQLPLRRPYSLGGAPPYLARQPESASELSIARVSQGKYRLPLPTSSPHAENISLTTLHISSSRNVGLRLPILHAQR